MKLNFGCGLQKLPFVDGWLNWDSDPKLGKDIYLRPLTYPMPFGDNSLDVINAYNVLHKFTKKECVEILKEFYRTLRPGGYAFILVPNWRQSFLMEIAQSGYGWDSGTLGALLKEGSLVFDIKCTREILEENAKEICNAFGVSSNLAKKHLVNYIKAHAWWLQKKGTKDTVSWQEVESEIWKSGVYKYGYNEPPSEPTIPLIKNITNPTKVEPIVIEKNNQKNRLLWVTNVAWVGGTAFWAAEAIEALPNWEHTLVHLKGEAEPTVFERYTKAGVDFAKVDQVTPALLENVDPTAVILSNTNPRDIEGDNPWGWLTNKYNVFYVHHSPVRPWLPGAKADIFVSDYLSNKYNNLKERMQRAMVVPTGIDILPFLHYKKKRGNKSKKNIVIGRLTNDNPQKYPKELLDILNEVGCQYEIVGGEKYYGPAKDLYTPLTIGSMSPIEFLDRWDIFVYKSSIPETWGRAVVEAMAAGLPVVADNSGGIIENIIHGETGFLCSSDDEFIEYLKVLSESAKLRNKMGKAAREYVLSNFSENQFKKHVEPLLVEYALRR